ncbi:Hexose transporter 2, partial [Hanseniaspora osmophila]
MSESQTPEVLGSSSNTPADQASQLSTPSNNHSHDASEIKHDGFGEPEFPPEDEPALKNTKGLSAYFGVVSLCLCVAFGGFVFGYDTGSISGFVAMSGFKERYGSHNSSGYYLSNVRTGLMVSIFNIGCAIGGLILGKLGDMVGRKLALMVV